MRNIYKKILNRRFILSIALTFLFATVLRMFYLQILDLTLSLDKMDYTSLSFIAIITIFKATIHIILEEYMGESLTIGYNNNTALYMENENPSGRGSSDQPGSSSTQPSKPTASLSPAENLFENIYGDAMTMLKSLHQLEEIKRIHKVSYFLSKEGDLSVDVPSSMSDSLITEISSKVSDTDIAYNKSLERYNKLLELDRKLYNGRSNGTFAKHYDMITDRYKNLFEREGK